MRWLLTGALWTFISASAAYGAETGTIAGVVREGTTRKPVSYASVIVKAVRMDTLSNEDGTFRIENVPPGRYEILVSSVIHEMSRRTVTVRAGKTTRVVLRAVLPEHWRRRSDPIRLGLGRHAQLVPGQLTCELRPARAVFRVGERPSFTVRIHNHGPKALVLVSSQDGSADGRYPLVTLEETPPGTGIQLPRPGFVCANMNGLGVGSFVEVKPGESFDPYGNGWRSRLEVQGIARAPGRYTAVFRYSTDESDGRKWLGWPGPRELPRNMTPLFHRVPVVTLEAATEFVIEE